MKSFIVIFIATLLSGFAARAQTTDTIALYQSGGNIIILREPVVNHTAAFTVSRATGSSQNFEQIATVNKAATITDFRKIAGDNLVDALKKGKKTGSDNELWRYISTHDTLSSYGFLGLSLNFLRAMGDAYIDETVKSLPPGSKVTYHVAIAGQNNFTTLTCTTGLIPFEDKPLVVSKQQGDSLVSIKWAFKVQTSQFMIPMRANVFFEKTKGIFEILPTPAYMRKVKDSAEFSFAQPVVPGKAYKFYIQPVDIWNNPLNITSDTVTVFSVNTQNVPQLKNFRIKDTVNGIWMGWKKVDTSLFLAAIQIQRATAATGPFEILKNIPVKDTAYLDNNIVQGQVYYYRLRVAGQNDNIKTATTFTGFGSATHVDKKTKPNAPYHLTAATVAGGVKLNWQAPDNVRLAGYYVFRSAGIDTLTPQQISHLVKTTEYLDTTRNMSARVLYNYTVKAVSLSDIKSNYSVIAQAHLPIGNDKLVTPAFLNASYKDNQVVLSWQDVRQSDAFITGFVLYKRKKQQVAAKFDNTKKASEEAARMGFARVTPAIIKSAFYTDQLPNTDTYEYAVASVDGAGGESGLSAMAENPVIANSLIAPAKLTARNVGNKVALAWLQADANGITGYAIYRKVVGEKDFKKLLTVDGQKTNYTDNSVQPQTQYVYRVKSVGKQGESTGFASVVYKTN